MLCSSKSYGDEPFTCSKIVMIVHPLHYVAVAVATNRAIVDCTGALVGQLASE